MGLVRSAKSAGKLRKATGATDDQVVIGDAMDPASLAQAMQGCDSVILCSSATPKVRRSVGNNTGLVPLHFLVLFSSVDRRST